MNDTCYCSLETSCYHIPPHPNSTRFQECRGSRIVAESDERVAESELLNPEKFLNPTLFESMQVAGLAFTDYFRLSSVI